MAHKDIKARIWQCDGCETTHISLEESLTLPDGWGEHCTEFINGEDVSKKGLDLCPTCLIDPDAAAKRWKASMG
ncbi:hypothetical protein Pan258_21430 [Symmachiella dynata]|nr:hypothetical protein Pan258_21430 [Symmachiella dynata]